MAEKTLLAGYVSDTGKKQFSCIECVDKLSKPRTVVFKAELDGKEKCAFCNKKLGDELVSTEKPSED